ncbi:hypothetical protein F4775DRAFT_135707 [Biscogniauxia sp. FL1348]|nr:hypothetical protein F4775DRAFT_135707 [Biscogniauxia sp. FL1348]
MCKLYINQYSCGHTRVVGKVDCAAGKGKPSCPEGETKSVVSVAGPCEGSCAR